MKERISCVCYLKAEHMLAAAEKRKKKKYPKKGAKKMEVKAKLLRIKRFFFCEE